MKIHTKNMPKKTVVNETAAATPVRASKPKTTSVAPVAATSKPRVTTAKHSKAAAPVAVKNVLNVHDQIAAIAYGYWEARGYQHGSAEQDWLRAEQQLLSL